MDEALKRVADVLGVDVARARVLLEWFEPEEVVDIVYTLAFDRQTKRAIEEQARTHRRWWRW